MSSINRTDVFNIIIINLFSSASAATTWHFLSTELIFWNKKLLEASCFSKTKTSSYYILPSQLASPKVGFTQHTWRINHDLNLVQTCPNQSGSFLPSFHLYVFLLPIWYFYIFSSDLIPFALLLMQILWGNQLLYLHWFISSTLILECTKCHGTKFQ